MGSIGFPQARPSPCKTDALGVERGANGTVGEKSTYLKKRITFIREARLAEEIEVSHIRGDSNRADILTKGLGAKLYKKMRDAVLNVRQMALRVHERVSFYTPWA